MEVLDRPATTKIAWTSSTLVVENFGKSILDRGLQQFGLSVFPIDENITVEDENYGRLPELTPESIQQLSMYEILGFERIGGSASEDEIKQSYHQALLKYHPDKTGRGQEDIVFIKLQEAFETLSDKKKRQAYDSILDFDDSIPSGLESGDFYEIYGPVFKRNERYASNLPAPQLGDDNTDLNEVYKFYDYWTKFRSWRDFSLTASEHDISTAESREERRWMQKENDKKAKELKRKEYARLSLLVERAMKNDPRIEREKQREREERKLREDKKRLEERKKKEALEKRRKEREEAERRGKEEASNRRAAREKLRQEILTGVKTLQEREDGKVSAIASQNISMKDLEKVCMRLETDVLEKVASDLRAGDISYLWEKVAPVASPGSEKMRKGKSIDKSSSEVEWTEKELSNLSKALLKFPPGAGNRWDQIANYLNHSSSNVVARSRHDCIRKYQELQNAPTKHGEGSSNRIGAEIKEDDERVVWTTEQQQKLEEGLRIFPSSLDKKERWQKIADHVEGHTLKECIERYKFLRKTVQQRKSSAT